MRLYRDRHGVARASGDAELAPLAEFLASDLQEDVAAGRRLLTLLRHGTGEFEGNAFALSVHGEQVVLENLFTEREHQMPTARVAAQLELWLTFISNG